MWVFTPATNNLLTEVDNDGAFEVDCVYIKGKNLTYEFYDFQRNVYLQSWSFVVVWRFPKVHICICYLERFSPASYWLFFICNRFFIDVHGICVKHIGCGPIISPLLSSCTGVRSDWLRLCSCWWVSSFAHGEHPSRNHLLASNLLQRYFRTSSQHAVRTHNAVCARHNNIAMENSRMCLQILLWREGNEKRTGIVICSGLLLVWGLLLFIFFF